MEPNGVQTPPPRELETLLSDEDKNNIEIKKFSFTKDVEASDFDPFSDRKLANPTSNMDTLAHLLKASLGTGILSMPYAFMRAGLLGGILFTVLVAVVCTHCSYVLIKCAHILYKRTKKSAMSFPEVAESALKNGPQWVQKWAYSFRVFIIASLFITYFGTCSVYTVLVAENILDVVKHYSQNDENFTKINDVRFFIIALLLPLILLSWVRNLKYLAPVSMIANLFMGLGLGITFYYFVGTSKLSFENKILFNNPAEWPEFFSITIFAMEAIGVVMPLENSMKTPKSLLGCCGVLNKGMTGVTITYMIVGFLGYLRYEDVNVAVTLSLKQEDIAAQIVKIAIAIAVYCTFGLQFFVCLDIMWNAIKDKFTKRPDFADYVMRTILVTLCVLLAVAVPTIAPFMGVIGAFCFSILGLIAPAFIEVITYWDIGFGPYKYLIWKNVLVAIFGVFSLVFGTRVAILGIIKRYST